MEDKKIGSLKFYELFTEVARRQGKLHIINLNDIKNHIKVQN